MSEARCTGNEAQPLEFTMRGRGLRIQPRSKRAHRISLLNHRRLFSASTQCLVPGTRHSRRHIGIATLLFVLTLTPLHRAPAVESPTAGDSYANKLAALATKCDELGLKEQAEITRTWVIRRHPKRQYLFLPAVDTTAPKSNASEHVRLWHRKFMELRRERAAELLAAVKASGVAHGPARSYQELFEALREDPDQAEARRILGYVKSGSDWKLAGAEKATARQPAFNHPKLGWRARGWWSLETPHFEIVSNHSAREINEAGAQLENLAALWRQVFFAYWSTPGALAARLAGQDVALSDDRPKMKVVLFKSQEEYAAYVAGSHPKAAKTLGIYDDKQHTTYFFGGDKAVYPTWYHEATHQLFNEAVARAGDQAPQESNFWALEGVALYMESLTDRGGYWTVGGCDADRLQFARYRVLSGELNLPLAQISALTRDQIQKSDDIGQIYTQSAGLTHFLIDGEEGRYRDALLTLVAAVYRGTESAELLSKASGQPSAKLDEQYRTFLQVTDEDLAGIPDVARLKNLSLCRTAVTDAGLARFARSKNLEWLDLSGTVASDEGLKNFTNNSGLQQLFLEGTKITPASLSLISRFKQLEELDLSRLPVHDEDLAAVGSLRLLKVLYLTGCPLTDEGLTHLRGLKQLERLDRSGTKVTDEGFRKLKTAIPKLN